MPPTLNTMNGYMDDAVSHKVDASRLFDAVAARIFEDGRGWMKDATTQELANTMWSFAVHAGVDDDINSGLGGRGGGDGGSGVGDGGGDGSDKRLGRMSEETALVVARLWHAVCHRVRERSSSSPSSSSYSLKSRRSSVLSSSAPTSSAPLSQEELDPAFLGLLAHVRFAMHLEAPHLELPPLPPSLEQAASDSVMLHGAQPKPSRTHLQVSYALRALGWQHDIEVPADAPARQVGRGGSVSVIAGDTRRIVPANRSARPPPAPTIAGGSGGGVGGVGGGGGGVGGSDGVDTEAHLSTAPHLGWLLALDMGDVVSRVAVEFDGPSHYMKNVEMVAVGADRGDGDNEGSKEGDGDNGGGDGGDAGSDGGDGGGDMRRMNGTTRFKRRLLAALGWRVATVGHEEWRRAQGGAPAAAKERKRLLIDKMGEVGVKL